MTDTTRTPSTRRRALRWSLYAAVPLVAIAVAFFATRTDSEPAAAAGHAHGAAPAPQAAQPVMLTADQIRRIGVTFAVAAMKPLTREIRTVGQVKYDETRVKTVTLKIDGYVEELFVNFTGQAVQAGAPLLAIYSPPLVTAQEELVLAKRLDTEVAGAEPDARANVATLLASARRRLAYWDVPESDIRRIEATGQVQRTLTLRAPVDGFVVTKNVFQGQRVMAGDALYSIADLSVVWVEGEVFERDLPAIRLGQAVLAEFDAYPGRTRTGRITYLYPTLNPETRTTRVRVEFSNPGVQLKPGMYATFTWRGAAVPVLAVPRTAVISTGERNLLFVRRADGMLEPRSITLGASTPDYFEVLSGVSAGETVVKSATFLLDSESNLGSALGGMGNMPGMDMTTPKSGPSTPAPQTQKPPEGPNAHQNH